MSAETEDRAYTTGRQSLARDLFAVAMIELYEGQPPEADQMRIERADAILTLRRICAEEGDNDWPDDLHLSDIIEKHLVRGMSADMQKLREALETALEDLHILDSRLQDETERAGQEYKGLPSLRLVEAALEKVGER